MTFSEFAQKLYSVIGGGASISTFTKSILEQMLDEDHTDIPGEVKERTLRSYFDGSRSIRKLAEKMVAFLDGYEFAEGVKDCSDDSLLRLNELFSEEIGDCGMLHVADELKALFLRILHEAAETTEKKQKNKTHQKQSEGSDDSYSSSEGQEPVLVQEPDSGNTGNSYDIPFTDPLTGSRVIAQFHVEAHDNAIAAGIVNGGINLGERRKHPDGE